MQAKLFRIHVLDAETHEITAVERIDVPCVIVFRIGEDFLHLNGAVFHLGDFLGTLAIEARTVKCMQDKLLRQGRAVADDAADGAAELGVERFVERPWIDGGLDGDADETDAKPPDIDFLRRGVRLDGEQAFMAACQFREEGFLHAAFVKKQPKIGVVDDGDDVNAFFSEFDECVRDGVAFGFRGRVAAGVVGEVQKDDDFEYINEKISDMWEKKAKKEIAEVIKEMEKTPIADQ